MEKVTLGEVVGKERLKELVYLYRLVITVHGKIHIAGDIFQLEDPKYPEGRYKIVEIDIQGNWLELKYIGRGKPIQTR